MNPPLLVRLEPHPDARNAAVGTGTIRIGSIIASIPALSTALLPSEKGKRCDECHRVQTDSAQLSRCSGCASFWYCGTACQGKAWKAHHRKLCKRYNTFTASNQYQALTSHDQVDALLLSQLLVDPDVWCGERAQDDLHHPHATMLDLLGVPRSDGFVPPLCLPASAQTPETLALAADLYARFGNNNFVLHSHLDAYAHGVFPLASRLFNHSCAPSAVCKYIITPSGAPRMDVVALRDVAECEEVTIPYLDPALPYRTRQDALRANYGFTCGCRLCTFQSSIDPVPAPPLRTDTDSPTDDAALREFALGDVARGSVRIPTAPGMFEGLPLELRAVLHEDYLPALSEAFSRTAHEGPYGHAVEAGLTLLALYVVVYPPNYPQIGMHALELAKTLWNLLCAEPGALAGLGAGSEEQVRRHAGDALAFATGVLSNFGAEGDEGGPLDEVQVLGKVLEDDAQGRAH
ncbi:SET domain-containing protein [Epithele typhae]|uniref:SET domain-containing protein n=1 Tax=Epithele typhae TaxID=378194 RepID=UPI0020072458|nr:SET domain-containing protein [Epithele typhae]KAH9922858.1 SET domain-containing protein [Epithele typhae]